MRISYVDISLYYFDLASHHDGIYGFKFPSRFLGISCRDLTFSFASFTLLLETSLRAQRDVETAKQAGQEALEASLQA